MSYTVLDGANAGASFEGVLVYTPLAGTAAGVEGAQWTGAVPIENQTGTASGWQATEFGPATFPFPQDAPAEGWLATDFGAPAYELHKTIRPQGWTATQFGTPGISLALRAAGLQAGVMGSPRLVNVVTAEGFGPTARVPMAYYAFNQTLKAAGSNLGAKFGTGYALLKALGPLQHNTTAAKGWRATTWGDADALATRVSPAIGLDVAKHGTPVLRLSQPAASWQALAGFGVALAIERAAAQGFRSAGVGAPVARLTLAATGLTAAKFGTPKGSRPGDRQARGFGGVRFGVPRGRIVFGQPASGFGGATFGQPEAFTVCRALPVPVRARLGQPTIERTPAC